MSVWIADVLGDPTVAFDVYGLAGPQGSKSVFVNPRTGRAQTRESSAKVQPWRQAVAIAARQAARGLEPLSKSVAVRVTFWMPCPVDAPKWRRYQSTMPDLDKLLRSTFDGISFAGVWADDARVVTVAAEQRYSDSATGARIEIWDLHPHERDGWVVEWVPRVVKAPARGWATTDEPDLGGAA